jgi:hypothetical protein
MDSVGNLSYSGLYGCIVPVDVAQLLEGGVLRCLVPVGTRHRCSWLC